MSSRTIKLVAATVLVATCIPTLAHISYSGRDFGTINGNSVTISNQTVTSNFGWADASDLSLAFDASYAAWHSVDGAGYIAQSFTNGIDNLYYGDSHKGKAFRFHLDTAQTLTITAGANATATATSVAGLTAAFSVYQGLAAVAPYAATQTALAASPDHDFAAASEAWRTAQVRSTTGNSNLDYLATQGSWNALGNWSIGGDGDLSSDFSQLSSLKYLSSAFSTVANGQASTTLSLGAGDYTIFVGGNDLLSKNATDAGKAYGISLSVAAVPEPQTYALLLAGLGMAGVMRRRQR